MEKVDFFRGFQELLLCQPATALRLLLQGPQLLDFSLEESIAPLGHRHLLLQLAVQACAVIHLQLQVLERKLGLGVGPCEFSVHAQRS